jgi:TolA-binding protein
MSFTYGFYNSYNGDRKYDAVQFSSLFDGLITDGVFETIDKGFIVLASDVPNTVIVQTGRAWFNHTWNYNDSKMPLVNEKGIPSEDCLRYDAVILDINSNNNIRENQIIWVYGEETTGDPEKPILIKEAHHWQYPLCYVLRDHEDKGKITQDSIINCVGTSECPFVTGVVTGLTTDDLITQWDAEWKTYISQYVIWLDDSKKSFQEWLDDRYSSFDDWFENVKDKLSEDVAAKLQSQIDELNKTIETTVSTQINDLKEDIDSSLADGKIKFGVDENGNYGYIKDGADSVTPFKKGEGTASPAQVLSGYSFTSTNYQDVTDGTMANNGAWTSTTSGSGKTSIPAGYHDGTGYVDTSGAYNAGVTAADGRANTSSTNYKTGYNAGVAATKKGTAGAAQVLSGYTFTNSSSVGASGTMTNRGAISTTISANSSYTIPAGYHNGSGKVSSSGLYKVKTGSFNKTGSNGTGYQSVSTGLSKVSGIYGAGTKTVDGYLCAMCITAGSSSTGTVSVTTYDNNNGTTFTVKWIAYGT